MEKLRERGVEEELKLINMKLIFNQTAITNPESNKTAISVFSNLIFKHECIFVNPHFINESGT